MIKTAVIMSVYNEEKHIRKAIESIMNQTYNKWIFYIMIDGSTDKTHDICMEYDEDERIIVYSRKENKGLAKSLNDLIKIVMRYHPKISYIARQDGDDVSLPDRLKKQIYFLNKNKDYGMVGSWQNNIDDNGTIISSNKTHDNNKDIIKDLFNDNPFCHGSVVFRVSIFKDVGLYDEDFARCQDYDLYLRIIRKYKVANIPEFLYNWRDGFEFHNMISVRKHYVGLARYKRYCDYMQIPYCKSNYKENHF